MSELGHDVTEAERRFDAWRRSIGLWLGPVLALLILALPSRLDPASHRLSAILAIVLVYWISEALPLPATALLGPALAVVLGVAPARDAFGPFADPVIFLFLGSFLIAEALRAHGLDRRMALAILSARVASRSPARARIAIGLVTALVSMWISNTAAAAMMLPIALGLVLALNEGGVRESPRAVLLALAFAASIGGVATPIGTPPNLIALGFLSRIGGVRIDFLRFMAIGLPLALVLLVCQFALLRWLHPPAVGPAGLVARIREERRQLAPWGPGQRACVIGFALAVALWLLPGVVSVLGIAETSLLGRVAGAFPESVVAVLVAGLLFAWPVGERRVISWEEGRQVDFGTLLLFGGGLSLGKMMFDTGLAAVWARALVDATGVTSLWGLTALATLVAILLTEVTSNTAAVSMLAPLVLALCEGLRVPIVPPVLGAAFGASMAFMLPISTPPNAIVYGTGRVPLMTLFRAGTLLDAMSFFAIQAVLRLMCPLLGLA